MCVCMSAYMYVCLILLFIELICDFLNYIQIVCKKWYMTRLIGCVKKRISRSRESENIVPEWRKNFNFHRVSFNHGGSYWPFVNELGYSSRNNEAETQRGPELGGVYTFLRKKMQFTQVT